jgi:hypothetical protein
LICSNAKANDSQANYDYFFHVDYLGSLNLVQFIYTPKACGKYLEIDLFFMLNSLINIKLFAGYEKWQYFL